MKVIENVYFELKNGVDVNEFLNSSNKFNDEFVSQQKGYINRKLLKNEKGWVDLVTWESMDCAKAVQVAMQGNSCAGEYLSHIEGKTVNVQHFLIEKDYK